MHPIERLRFVAQAEGTPQATVVSEAARALTALGDDPAQLVMAVRRMVAHHQRLGAMWWLGARVLTAPNAEQTAFEASEEIEDDDTPRVLARALDPDAKVLVAGWPPQVGEALAKRGSGSVMILDTGRDAAGLQRYLEVRGVDALLVPVTGLAAAAQACDLVAIECLGGGPNEGVFDVMSASLAAVAHAGNVPVWAAVGVGRIMPSRMWEAYLAAWESTDEPWEMGSDVVAWSSVDHIAGPDVVLVSTAVATLTTTPVAPELLA